ncbi:MAG: 3,4-dihydroxy-2-butanone-4-phosphate synthase [Altererythrobacter sp.]|nr:3,4-dihydroxy-2-butanone-4-phosphate synthase [Altererythrobacter sp.]OJU61211.1 MAG: hypothetical protein BGO08_08805 [Altererythrobacter sp. 66-12]
MTEAEAEELLPDYRRLGREGRSRGVVESALDGVREGRMAIVVTGDDKDPIGHLVVSARLTTPESVNFMATHGRGVVCLVIQQADLERLQLPMQHRRFGPSGREAPVSIEARDGVSTGISAADRARTVRVAADPASGPEDLISPGHIFPLLASEGGVFTLPGPAEAAVDLCRLAGLAGPATLCAVLDEDGAKAPLQRLLAFGGRFGIPVVGSRELLDYRCNFDRQLERVREDLFEPETGGVLRAIIYRSLVDGREVLALVHDADSRAGPGLIRLQPAISLPEQLGIWSARERMRQSLKEIGAAGRGAVLMLEPSSPGTLSRSVIAEEEKEPMAFADGALIARVLKELRFEEISLPDHDKGTALILAQLGLRIFPKTDVAR